MSEDIDKYVSKKLKYYRTKFDWPLHKLADELRVSLQQMHRYEQGTNKIPAGSLYKLSKMFQVDLLCFYEHFEELEKSTQYKVLLVEDNPDDEYFFRRCLCEFDESLEIYTLKDGTEAMDYFRELQDTHVLPFSKPDIVFMDLNLPSANGFEVLQFVKRRDAFSGIPVIILTSSVDKENMKKSYTLQANGFIKKSFIFKEYKEQIHRALEYWIRATSFPH